MGLKYCLDQEYLESIVALRFIPGATTYNELEESALCAYLEEESTPSKSTITVDQLDRIVNEELKITMRKDNSVSRIRNFFVTFHIFLRTHGASWVLYDNPKLDVRHITSAIQPEIFCTRIELELSFGYKHL